MEPRKNFFPLKDNESVVNFFKEELRKDQPNLAQLSLILGFFEEANTCKSGASDPSSCPTLDEETYDALYCKFMALLQRDFSFNAENKPATREFVKSVADLVWGCLAKSYFKDRLHIQNLYSFLTGNRLDCFGVALTVVAVCQALGYHDVHLCLSEDHAWVSFGINGSETAEVTWHGKGNEDKRGRPVEFDEETSKSWLYLNGNAVCCTRHIEVASIVSSINTTISHNTDSPELAKLQKELLWILYDMGHLKKYPMALCNLATLEETSPTIGRLPCQQIFEEAIKVARELYNNQHIYPYTYLGGYYNRKKLYSEAIKCWVQAAYVAGKYNYSKEDEEMYKEFYEIANDLIPNILKDKDDESISYTQDPEFYSNMIKFYDGICLWEEGSLTPVLHADWAKKLVQSINKFTPDCRSTFSLDKKIEHESNKIVKVEDKVADKQVGERKEQPITQANNVPVTQANNKPVTQADNKPFIPADNKPVTLVDNKPVTQEENKPVEQQAQNSKPLEPSTCKQTNDESAPLPNESTENKPAEQPTQQSDDKPEQPLKQPTDESAVQAVAQQNDKPVDQNEVEKRDEPMDQEAEQKKPVIEAVAPQNDKPVEQNEADKRDEPMDQEAEQKKPVIEAAAPQNDKPVEQNEAEKRDEPMDQEAEQKKPVIEADTPQNDKPMEHAKALQNDKPTEKPPEKPDVKPPKPEITLELHSAKMKDLRKLITSSGKLNTSAIKLQLTAQSQVSIPKNRRRSSLKADVYLYDYDAQMKEEGAGDDDDVFVARKRRKRKNDDRNWTAAQS